jgi:hypothetical protein
MHLLYGNSTRWLGIKCIHLLQFVPGIASIVVPHNALVELPF